MKPATGIKVSDDFAWHSMVTIYFDPFSGSWKRAEPGQSKYVKNEIDVGALPLGDNP
jgi:hypothetical protein